MPKYICDKCGKEYKGNFCPNCGDKRTKKDEEQMTDQEVIADIVDDTKKYVSKKIKKMSGQMVVGFVLICIAIFLFFLGMYHKNSYYNSGNNSVNAYVGGDAYNYIINANYFSGYMALSGAFLVSGVLVIIDVNKKRD